MRRLIGACVIVLLALSLMACSSPSDLNFIPDGPSYAAGDLNTALADANPGSTASVSVEDASEVRQEALAELRKNGDEAALLADALTASFPTDVPAVPYRVERGMYEGEQAWIVFEAWGEEDTLAYRRVWVLSAETRDILAAFSVR